MFQDHQKQQPATIKINFDGGFGDTSGQRGGTPVERTISKQISRDTHQIEVAEEAEAAAEAVS